MDRNTDHSARVGSDKEAPATPIVDDRVKERAIKKPYLSKRANPRQPQPQPQQQDRSLLPLPRHSEAAKQLYENE